MVTSDAALAARAEIIREKGTDRSRFIRGDVDRYSWQTVGSSYLLSEPLAALVGSQWRAARTRSSAPAAAVFETYQACVRAARRGGRRDAAAVPPGCEPAYHIYFLRFTPTLRPAAAAFVRARGIEASSHFVPLHLSAYARRELGDARATAP